MSFVLTSDAVNRRARELGFDLCGVAPVWSSDGREIFYMNGTAMVSVPVESGDGAFRAAAPAVLFTGAFETGSPYFDVAPDGKYFLMVEADPDAKPTQVHVILNGGRELTRSIAPRPAP